MDLLGRDVMEVMKRRIKGYCELCGKPLQKFLDKIELKDNHQICSDCFIKYKRKGDKKNLLKMDISIYQKRKEVEEEMIKKEMDEKMKQIQDENKSFYQEQERMKNLPDEVFHEDILLTGNRTDAIQRNIDNCSEGEKVWIDEEDEWIKEEGDEYPERFVKVYHEESSKEIGKIPAEHEIQRQIKDYTFTGNFKKIGESKSLYVVIDATGKKKSVDRID